jgi:spore germination protein KA
VFEALRETGTRMPSSIGLALNIVGAIILGQAAVEAHLVSAPMVIIVSFSGVAGLMVNQLKGAVFYIRAAMIILSSAVGIVGVAVGFLMLNCMLANMSSLDVPFMSAFPPFCKYCKNDTFVRAPAYKMNYRQPYFSKNTKRQGRV